MGRRNQLYKEHVGICTRLFLKLQLSSPYTAFLNLALCAQFSALLSTLIVLARKCKLRNNTHFPIFDYFHLGNILYCVCINLSCGGFILFCNVWGCVFV